MTLPALISKLSGRTPRFVSVAGHIVPGAEVTAASNGFHHRSYGHVTPVRRHSNHGGVPPADEDCLPWWTDGPQRLDAERQAMHVAFPGFVSLATWGCPSWRGTLNTGRGRFELTIVHRPDHGLPLVVPTNPSLFRRREARRYRWSPYLYLNNNLCVAREDDWDPARDDAVTVTAWAAHWLATFTEWRITGGSWPCEGVSVDAA